MGAPAIVFPAVVIISLVSLLVYTYFSRKSDTVEESEKETGHDLRWDQNRSSSNHDHQKQMHSTRERAEAEMRRMQNNSYRYDDTETECIL